MYCCAMHTGTHNAGGLPIQSLLAHETRNAGNSWELEAFGFGDGSVAAAESYAADNGHAHGKGYDLHPE